MTGTWCDTLRTVFCGGVDPPIVLYRVKRKVRKPACKEDDVGHSHSPQ